MKLFEYILTAPDNIPGHISGASDYLIVVKEAAARQVTVVSRQLTAHTDVTFTRLQTVDRADVVKAAACDKIS